MTKKKFDEWVDWLFTMDYPTFITCCNTFPQFRERIIHAYHVMRTNTAPRKHDMQGFTRYHLQQIKELFATQYKDLYGGFYVPDCMPPSGIYMDYTLHGISKILCHYKDTQLPQNGIYNYPESLFTNDEMG
jgi:hypothetical protein